MEYEIIRLGTSSPCTRSKQRYGRFLSNVRHALGTLQRGPHSRLSPTLRYLCHRTHFTEKETDSERLSILPKVTMLGNGGTSIQTRGRLSKAHALSPDRRSRRTAGRAAGLPLTSPRCLSQLPLRQGLTARSVPR